MAEEEVVVVPAPAPAAAAALSSTQIKIAGFFILCGAVSLLVNIFLIKNPQTSEKTKTNSKIASIISSYVVLLSCILALTSSSATMRGHSLQGMYIGSYVLMFINSLILLFTNPNFLPHQLKTSWILLVVSLCLALSHKTPIPWKVAIVSISAVAIYLIIKYVKESPKPEPEPEPEPKPGDSCTPTTDAPNAQSYVLDKDLKCVVGECDNGFTKTSDNKCIYTQGDAVPLVVQHAVQQSLLDYIDASPQIFVKKKAIQSAPIYMLANKYDNNDCITKDNKVVESCTSDLITECDNFPNLDSTTKLGIECETVVGPLGISCIDNSDCTNSAFPDCTYSKNQDVAFCTT